MFFFSVGYFLINESLTLRSEVGRDLEGKNKDKDENLFEVVIYIGD